MFGKIVLAVILTVIIITLCGLLFVGFIALRGAFEENKQLTETHDRLKKRFTALRRDYEELKSDYETLKHEAAGVYLAMMKNESLQIIYYAEEEEL